MTIYDVLDQEGKITNRIVSDDPDDWTPPDGCTVRVSDGSPFGVAEPVAIPADTRAVNFERDRRIAAGFLFNGVLFQSRREDQKRINGAGTLAVIAIMGGAQSGDLRWHGGDADFAWIAADNSLISMDAQTVIAFGQAAAAREAAHVFAARALKSIDPIPADYAADAHWPE